MFTQEDFEQACRAVYAAMQPTLAHPWPLLQQATGVKTWVKHENHTPTGAFKVRGGLNYLARLMENLFSSVNLASTARFLNFLGHDWAFAGVTRKMVAFWCVM